MRELAVAATRTPGWRVAAASLVSTTRTIDATALGTVQDEDVIANANANGTWSTYAYGTSHGLTNDTLDTLDFNIP
jgi:hypothetical protein